ncbi:hypothetical protein F8388_006408 [Cannabis sativa]|uniref:Uncharacterized protein n=1 Tax=Cannabis sativa TaxID=3483 RepID=A0A7J6FBE9_CANSA|nr:hypothetical protein F8388_006408 [Cannabis sativa]KAF4400075.1 hypothetical protein G4B88_021289 [Cannabis sativa]
MVRRWTTLNDTVDSSPSLFYCVSEGPPLKLSLGRNRIIFGYPYLRFDLLYLSCFSFVELYGGAVGHLKSVGSYWIPIS